MEEKQGKSKGLVIVIIILVIVILGLAGYICYDKGVFGKADSGQKIEEKEKPKEEKEEEITDNTLIDDLSKKVSIVNIYDGYNNLPSEYSDKSILTNKYLSVSAYGSMDSKGNNVYNSTLNDKTKLRMVLLNGVNYTKVTIPEKEVNLKEKVAYKVLRGQTTVKEVEDAYLKIFGEEMKDYVPVNTGNNVCPSFYYDSLNKVYYGMAECGGIDSSSLVIYKNKFTIKGNEAYVYVNVGHTDGKNLYDDYPSKNNDKLNESNCDEKAGDKITEKNYKRFIEYKYIFKKDSKGNYYFEKVEKVDYSDSALNKYLGSFSDNVEDKDGWSIEITKVTNESLIANMNVPSTKPVYFGNFIIEVNNNKGIFTAVSDIATIGSGGDGKTHTISGNVELLDNSIKLVIEKSGLSEIKVNEEHLFKYKK